MFAHLLGALMVLLSLLPPLLHCFLLLLEQPNSLSMSELPILDAAHVKAEALRLGFFACGLAEAAPMEAAQVARREEWLVEGCHGAMAYLERNEDKRRDPRLLVEGVRTIVSVAMNYYTLTPATTPDGRQCHIPIARYARGKDYHDVMRARLQELLALLAQHYGEEAVEGARCFVDTAPVDERYWAWRAGLGWIGKNTQLIIPGAGSYFFLGELFLPLPADHYDTPTRNRCGSCIKCLRACPTKALSVERGLDARRCLSYLTIEHRGDTLPEGVGEAMGDMFYGCDRCADCCPWNRLARPTLEDAFQPSPQLLSMTQEEWRELTIEQYRELFRGSAVKRAKYEGLKRNIAAIEEKGGEE